jgi:peptide/nickel transport system substrate-binding protein
MGRARLVKGLLLSSAAFGLLASGAWAKDGSTAQSSKGAAGPKLMASGNLTTLQTEPDQGLDPAKAADSASGQMIGFLTEPLVSWNQKGVIVPALAQSWKITKAGRVYTFKLQPSARFSNGRAITAADVKFSLERLKRGANGKASLASVTSITAVDASTVRLNLSVQSSSLIEALANPYIAGIVPKKEVLANKKYFSKPSPTSGPWTLTDYQAKSHATLTANPYYWRKGFPNIKKITYTFIDDQSVAAPAIESGSADMASVGYADAQRMRQQGKYPIYETDQIAEIFWGLDTTKPPFSDKRVRQAVAYQFDRRARQANCWFGTGALSFGAVLRPYDPNYVNITTYDVARAAAKTKAEQLLDAAGWKVPSGGGTRVSQGVAGVADGTPLKFDVPYEGHWTAASCSTQLLQQNLKEIGFDATPVKYDDAAFWTDAGAGKFTMYHGGFGASSAADLYVNNFTSTGAYTSIMTHLKNPVVEGDGRTVDQLIAAAVKAPTAADRKRLFGILEQWQADYLPWIVVGHQFGQTATSPKLKNYFATPRTDFPRALVTAYMSK